MSVESLPASLSQQASDLTRQLSMNYLIAELLQRSRTEKTTSVPDGSNGRNSQEDMSYTGNAKGVSEFYVYYKQFQKEGEGQQYYERIQVFPFETVKQIKLRLKSKLAFTSSSALILGNRELAEHEVVEQVIMNTRNSQGIRHVIAYIKDLETMTIDTRHGEFIFRRGDGSTQLPVSQRSGLLTDALKGMQSDQVDAPKSADDLTVRGQFCNGASRSAQCFNWELLLDQAVVHLVVHNPDTKFSAQVDGEYFELTVNCNQTVEEFAKQVVDTKGLHVFQHKLYLNGLELAANKSLKDIGVSQGSILELAPAISNSQVGVVSPMRIDNPSHLLYQNFTQAQQGLANGAVPELSSSGSGGSYFLHDPEGVRVAVFKPKDEEPMAIHNPRGYVMGSPNAPVSRVGQNFDGLRRGIRPGEGAVREVIAFLLDHEHFSGVPPTALVNLVMPEQGFKVGSLQGFVHADGDCEERGCSVFPVQEVHKIAVLDIRLANTDRNAGNILAKKNENGQWKLTPIDHGYCLPDSFEDICFEWMYWPQAAQPFSPNTLKYIENLDVNKDLELINSHNLKIRPECERVLQVCFMLLKKAAAMGLTLFDVAMILCRQQSNQSPIEKLDREALRQAESMSVKNAGTSLVQYRCPNPNHNPGFYKYYLKNMGQLLDSYLEEFVSCNGQVYY
eukprot:TRINITY_DN757_c3_g1_i1.p1 TRINITY_DN757_c3_g1~~TRINITY_DN757_c3_g1_i1.p1  ORF type:complete len:731 (+),score=33.84 TRINITY_DN757_c3_g1_i1:172-2193(+)